MISPSRFIQEPFNPKTFASHKGYNCAAIIGDVLLTKNTKETMSFNSEQCTHQVARLALLLN